MPPERDRVAGELDAVDRDHGVVEAANQGGVDQVQAVSWTSSAPAL
jgi:hypothetical protein